MGGERWLLEWEAMDLLRSYGIARPDYRLATTVEAAVEGAEDLGYPVVMKIVSPDVLHKSDVGGVKTGLGDAQIVAEAYDDLMRSLMSSRPDARVEGVVLYPQVEEGLEVIVGVIRDAQFGPAVMFGSGGIFAELLKDVSFRVVPLTEGDAREMLAEIRGHLLLQGVRGQGPYDRDALVDLLLSVSRMAVERGDIRELDLNPVRVFAKGLQVLDARVLVEQ